MIITQTPLRISFAGGGTSGKGAESGKATSRMKVWRKSSAPPITSAGDSTGPQPMLALPRISMQSSRLLSAHHFCMIALRSSPFSPRVSSVAKRGSSSRSSRCGARIWPIGYRRTAHPQLNRSTGGGSNTPRNDIGRVAWGRYRATGAGAASGRRPQNRRRRPGRHRRWALTFLIGLVVCIVGTWLMFEAQGLLSSGFFGIDIDTGP